MIQTLHIVARKTAPVADRKTVAAADDGTATAQRKRFRQARLTPIRAANFEGSNSSIHRCASTARSEPSFAGCSNVRVRSFATDPAGLACRFMSASVIPGLGVKLSTIILAGPTVLSAVL